MTAERTIRVSLQGHAYDITVRPGLHADAGAKLRALSKAAKAVVITDSNIPAATVSAMVTSLAAAGFAATVATVPAGEEHKSVEHVLKLYDQILPLRIDRHTPIVALGGGVIGDMTGFVAATILRGVPFVQCPTTLLSMVDASVGGKTGVNHTVGKNLIGAFHQPIAVLVDPNVLKTLPQRELRGGLAECIKHDLIRDAEGFANLEKDIGRALAVDIKYLTELVAHNVAIKARVVEADPFERGERAHLNFGHTFGHAIESISKYSYSHGESVALGMVAATRLGVLLDLLSEADERRIRNVITAAGLPIDGLKLDRNQVVDSMAFDKKVAGGKIRFVLLDGIGKAVVRDDVPVALVREAVESLV
ncbi:3-dehydroquinate synthase [Humisphaera borealis]|uniref:3-dehydroquinate synthase n=1 Tax=Humisphaera borealis TaxID=2807512 RepID=A0A7M2WTN6_9BACT|nr:3-dehydroquinate synthase [Humisphaera borealis]QOV88846.1 3-dehydroquinate synthase [Humisphaera borealis]